MEKLISFTKLKRMKWQCAECEQECKEENCTPWFNLKYDNGVGQNKRKRMYKKKKKKPDCFECKHLPPSGNKFAGECATCIGGKKFEKR